MLEGGALNGVATLACAPYNLGFTAGNHPGTDRLEAWEGKMLRRAHVWSILGSFVVNVGTCLDHGVALERSWAVFNQTPYAEIWSRPLPLLHI